MAGAPYRRGYVIVTVSIAVLLLLLESMAPSFVVHGKEPSVPQWITVRVNIHTSPVWVPVAVQPETALVPPGASGPTVPVQAAERVNVPMHVPLHVAVTVYPTWVSVTVLLKFWSLMWTEVVRPALILLDKLKPRPWPATPTSWHVPNVKLHVGMRVFVIVQEPLPTGAPVIVPEQGLFDV